MMITKEAALAKFRLIDELITLAQEPCMPPAGSDCIYDRVGHLISDVRAYVEVCTPVDPSAMVPGVVYDVGNGTSAIRG